MEVRVRVRLSRNSACPFLVALATVPLLGAAIPTPPPLSAVLSLAARSAAAFADPTRRIVCQESDIQSFVVRQRSMSVEVLQEDAAVAYRRIVAVLTVARGPGPDAQGVPWYDTAEAPRVSWDESRAVISAGALQPSGPSKAAETARRFGVPAQYPLDAPTPLPRLAVILLDAANQPRFAFRKTGESRVDGVAVWEVTYQENVVPSPPAAATRGTFWIEPSTGHVLKSVLTQAAVPLIREVAMTYRLHEATGLFLPVRMKERSDVSETMRIETTGTFTNCRAVQAGPR
jgi:hypothetical protein